MKKALLASAMLLTLATLSSCDLKQCYCCVSHGDIVEEEESYVGEEKACRSLDNSYQVCLEAGERIPGCEGVAVGYKKK